MQLTNICRDVLEDAERGRVYLPATRLAAVGLTPEDLLSGRASSRGVAEVVTALLTLSQRYYASGDAGLFSSLRLALAAVRPHDDGLHAPLVGLPGVTRST